MKAVEYDVKRVVFKCDNCITGVELDRLNVVFARFRFCYNYYRFDNKVTRLKLIMLVKSTSMEWVGTTEYYKTIKDLNWDLPKFENNLEFVIKYTHAPKSGKCGPLDGEVCTVPEGWTRFNRKIYIQPDKIYDKKIAKE